MVYPGTLFPRDFRLWWSTIGSNLYIPHDVFTSCRAQFIEESARIELFAQCILEPVDSFSQIGLSSGTTLLGLIPAGLALIPSQGLGVKEAWHMGPSYFLLSTFVGNTGPGVSAHELAKNIWENKSGADLLATFESRKPMIQGWWRTVLIGGSFVIVLAIIAAATVLGLQTVLTWQAHIWWFPLLWVLLRMAPGLVELSFLCIIEWMLRRPGFPGNERTRHLFWLLLVFVWVLSLAGNGIIIIFGTAVLGSSTLIDGATARTYLFCLPTLYAVIHLLLLAAYLPTMPKGDQVNLDEVPLQSANPSFTQGEESRVEGRSPATIHMTF